MPENEAHGLLKGLKLRPFTDKTITDRKTLVAQIEAGRKSGIYEARNEGSEGVSALAMAAVVNGQPVGISLAGPTERMDKNRKSYLDALRDVRATLLAPQQ